MTEAKIQSPWLERLKLAREIGLLSLPLGLVVAFIHELGFFSSIGVGIGSAFLVLPFPLHDLIRIALYFASVVFLGAVLGGSLLFATWTVVLMPASTALESIGSYTQSVAALPVRWYERLTQLPWNEFRIRWPTLEDLDSSQALRGLQIRVFYATVIAVFLGLVLLPMIFLVFDLGFVTGTLSKVVAIVLAFAVVLAAQLYLTLACFGCHVALKKSITRNRLPLLIGLAGVLIGFLLAEVFSTGQLAGAWPSQQISTGSTRTFQLLASNSSAGRCQTPTGAKLLRTYSNGYLLGSQSQVVWLPLDERAPCWAVGVEPVKARAVEVVPTLFGLSLSPLTFTSFALYR
jgi:hypothetical protein